MKRPRFPILILLLISLVGCGEATPTDSRNAALLAEWTGPYGGVPAFDKMDLSILASSMEAGMEMNLAEIDEIANNPDPPTTPAHPV